MASSEGNYRRGPYFDGTNFASWKHKMKMHILGHNPAAWGIICVGMQGEFFEEGKVPDREATPEELRMLQNNAQASFPMSSMLSLDHEIVQLPDTVGMLWVYQTSQRNWVAIKVHYRYLRKCLLGWHESRLGFVTPYDGEVSLGPLGKTSS